MTNLSNSSSHQASADDGNAVDVGRVRWLRHGEDKKHLNRIQKDLNSRIHVHGKLNAYLL